MPNYRPKGKKTVTSVCTRYLCNASITPFFCSQDKSKIPNLLFFGNNIISLLAFNVEIKKGLRAGCENEIR